MTYAELLADNQRLRKRIIELEQENARLKGQYEPLLPESKSLTLESHKSLTEEEKEIDMCQAVDEMIEDGRKICRRDGKSHERYSCFDGNVVHWVIREAVQM